ncbi:MAG: alginate lyase family protein [Bacteroidales bacterium]|nr:alginate lyase family protein [Bacteroidales bacterium]
MNHKLVFYTRTWLIAIILNAAGYVMASDSISAMRLKVEHTLAGEIIKRAMADIDEKPITLTSYSCERSAGGKNDFYSEGDYWWPDPENTNGPYIRKDGLTNPDNLVAHRHAMVRLSVITGNLVSAWLLTKDTSYAQAALKHIRAWFITDSTQMNPHMLYAQAIKGLHTGRGIGIIDGIHLIEVVQSIMILEKEGLIQASELSILKDWFGQYVNWLITNEYGLEEMNQKNNHGTCWNMQVAQYAKFTGNDSLLTLCRNNYTENLLPQQMADNGSFPLELKRTKPYGYALFNLDAMVMNCYILSDPLHNMWEFKTPNGRSILKAIEFMAPYVAEKSKWPYAPDVMFWDEWPVAHPAFLLGAMHFNRPEWLLVWEKYDHFPENSEVLRNLPVRNPLLWLY